MPIFVNSASLHVTLATHFTSSSLSPSLASGSVLGSGSTLMATVSAVLSTLAALATTQSQSHQGEQSWGQQLRHINTHIHKRQWDGRQEKEARREREKCKVHMYQGHQSVAHNLNLNKYIIQNSHSPNPYSQAIVEAHVTVAYARALTMIDADAQGVLRKNHVHQQLPLYKYQPLSPFPSPVSYTTSSAPPIFSFPSQYQPTSPFPFQVSPSTSAQQRFSSFSLDMPPPSIPSSPFNFSPQLPLASQSTTTRGDDNLIDDDDDDDNSAFLRNPSLADLSSDEEATSCVTQPSNSVPQRPRPRQSTHRRHGSTDPQVILEELMLDGINSRCADDKLRLPGRNTIYVLDMKTLHTWFAVFLAQGLIRMENIEDFWNKNNPISYNQWMAKAMSDEEFMFINNNLCVDTSQVCKDLTSIAQRLWIPDTEICIDDDLWKWSGLGGGKCKNNKKADKCGLNNWIWREAHGQLPAGQCKAKVYMLPEFLDTLDKMKGSDHLVCTDAGPFSKRLTQDTMCYVIVLEHDLHFCGNIYIKTLRNIMFKEPHLLAISYYAKNDAKGKPKIINLLTNMNDMLNDSHREVWDRSRKEKVLAYSCFAIVKYNMTHNFEDVNKHMTSSCLLTHEMAFPHIAKLTQSAVETGVLWNWLCSNLLSSTCQPAVLHPSQNAFVFSDLFSQQPRPMLPLKHKLMDWKHCICLRPGDGYQMGEACGMTWSLVLDLLLLSWLAAEVNSPVPSKKGALHQASQIHSLSQYHHCQIEHNTSSTLTFLLLLTFIPALLLTPSISHPILLSTTHWARTPLWEQNSDTRSDKARLTISVAQL
ncbi:hypothetical protein Pelo_16568 [Pelomyxa schiedti]|nr:hypothetical protein Pelo_16568 [Pelomyxa schiedti]